MSGDPSQDSSSSLPYVDPAKVSVDPGSDQIAGFLFDNEAAAICAISSSVLPNAVIEGPPTAVSSFAANIPYATYGPAWSIENTQTQDSTTPTGCSTLDTPSGSSTLGTPSGSSTLATPGASDDGKQLWQEAEEFASIQTETQRSSSSRKQRVSDENKHPRLRALEKNRVAASRCRQRKREHVEDLVQQNDKAGKLNDRLRKFEDQLRREFFFLRDQLLKHDGCDCKHIHDYLRHFLPAKIEKIWGDTAQPTGGDDDKELNAQWEPGPSTQ